MKPDSQWRTFAKSIPPIYWFAGFTRYLGFRTELHRENEIYRQINPARIPPPILRYRVHRAFDQESYVANGKVISRHLVNAFIDHGVELSDRVVLDFACGPGRVISEFALATNGCDLYGSDIDVEAITWARSNLADVARFSTNTAAVPTDFASDMFDAIYCVSLFTHLDEAAQNDWLAEMARILKPGGVFVTTTHGRFAMESCTPWEKAQLQRDGFVYRVDRKGRFKVDGLPDFYQTTFHSVDYVRKNWSRFLPVVNHIEGGLNGHQDIVVMRKSETA